MNSSKRKSRKTHTLCDFTVMDPARNMFMILTPLMIDSHVMHECICNICHTFYSLFVSSVPHKNMPFTLMMCYLSHCLK